MNFFKWQRSLLLIICFIFLFTGAQTTYARDYSFDSLQVDVHVQEDGSLWVKETRKVTFDGKFSGFYQYINKNERETIKDISLQVDGVDFERNPVQEIGPAGTFFVRDDGSNLYIDWSIEAFNQTKIFE